MQTSEKPEKRSPLLIVAAVIIVAAAIGSTFFKGISTAPKTVAPTAIAATNKQGDLEIPIDNVSDTATFYAYDQLDTPMEVLAVRASDGSIRTAFNTCQVCYNSGRGYYVQDGASLVCQNCCNRFALDDVGVARGGCNPVPISDEYKSEKDGKIIISKALFEESEQTFANWKA